MTTKTKEKWQQWLKYRWPYLKRDLVGVAMYILTYPKRLWTLYRSKVTVRTRLDWYAEYRARQAAETRIKRLEEALKLQGTDANWKEECVRLQAQVKKLKQDVTQKREALERKNRELDALHYVWCDGGCEGGAHRYTTTEGEVTETVVREAVRNTNRLVSWFNNHEFKALDRIDEDGVKNRFMYIYGTRAYKRAMEISKTEGAMAAWAHIEDAITNLRWSPDQ